METNQKVRSLEVKLAILKLYKQFSQYGCLGLKVCPACYTPEEVEYLETAPVNEIETGMARKLLWETKGHWASAEVYKHFLPRILEVLAPPEQEEGLFPAHLFEVLEEMRFSSWKAEERSAVFEFLTAVTPFIYRQDSEDSFEWKNSMNDLK